MCVCVCVCVCARVCDRRLQAIAVPGLRIVTWFGTHGSSVSVKVLGKYPIVVVNGDCKFEEMKRQ